MFLTPFFSDTMSTQLTDDAVGKDVVDADGDTIGIVSAYENGTARVDPDPGLTDKFKTKLNWEDSDGEDYPLQESAVETVTTDEIRVQYTR